MKIIVAAALLLMTLAFQVSKAYPLWQASNGESRDQDSETAKASYVIGTLKALTILVQNNQLRIYDGPGPTGTLLSSLSLGSEPTSNDLLAFDPNYPTDATTYYFNLGDMLGLERENPCTLFESETDYPVIFPIRSVGADGIGNHIGREVFDKETYTFWITFNAKDYILPPPGHPGWETQIVCGYPQPRSHS